MFFSCHFQVRLKCVQTLTSIYQHPDRSVSTPFIHMMAPPVIEHLISVGTKRPQIDTELAIVTEGIRMVETLVALTDENNSKLT